MRTAQELRMRSQQGGWTVTAENVDQLALDPAAGDRDQGAGQRILRVCRAPWPPSNRCDALLPALVERSSHRIAPVVSPRLGSFL
jgi:hypothetical protein